MVNAAAMFDGTFVIGCTIKSLLKIKAMKAKPIMLTTCQTLSVVAPVLFRLGGGVCVWNFSTLVQSLKPDGLREAARTKYVVFGFKLLNKKVAPV